jgi:hypothetical protein
MFSTEEKNEDTSLLYHDAISNGKVLSAVHKSFLPLSSGSK